MYFPIAFATLGDQTMVPLTGTELGAINFQFGYGSNYSASITSDPDALLVDRLTFNYMMGAVTSTLQQLYQSGLPPFITSAENQGSAYAYAAGAMVLGPDGNDWYSTVGSNTGTPGASPKWFLFNPTYAASKGLIPLASCTGGTYSFASLGSGCTLTYTVSGGVINAVSAVASGGTTYAVGDLIAPNGGNYDAVIKVTGVSGGVVTTVAILYGGTGYIAGTAVGTQIATVSKQQITIAGVLATDALFIMPNGAKLSAAAEWTVGNNTTGVHSTTFKISNGANAGTGTGVIIPQGTANSEATIIHTDGATDFWFSVGLAPLASALSPGRNIGGVAFDGTADIVPETILPASEASDTTCFPAFFNSASGTAQQPKYNASFSYNASTNSLTLTTFIGALTGNASTATTATDTASKSGTGSTYLTNTSPTITSPTLTTPALGTPASGTLDNCTTNTESPRNNSTQIASTAYVDDAASTIPQNSQSGDYTLVLSDGGKQIYHPSADTTARTWTIPANSGGGSVAFPIGTTITFVNDTSAGVITIAITTDTLVLAGAGTTGSRTLAASGMATAIKKTSTSWMITGAGLT